MNMNRTEGHDWTKLKGKKIYIKNTSGRIYTAKVNDVVTFDFYYVLYITDKYGKPAMIRNDEIVEWRLL